MYPQILAGAVIAATQVAIRRWFRADPPEPLLPIIELALRQLTSVSAE
jgi:MftR C-terminal domain